MVNNWLTGIIPPGWIPRALEISVALNFVLGLLLFFKSALNDIMVEAYKRRRQRRQRQQELLRELYGRMDEFENYHFLVLVTSGMAWNAKSEEERQLFVEKTEEMIPKVEDARAFLARHELEFPHSVRSLIDQLRREMVLPDLDSIGTKETIIERSDVVRQVVREMKSAISRHVE